MTQEPGRSEGGREDAEQAGGTPPDGWARPGTGGWGEPAPRPSWEKRPAAGEQVPDGRQPASGQPAHGQQPAYGQPAYGQQPPGWAPPPRPGVIPLRPLSMIEIFDGAFRSIRRSPGVMLGASAVVAAVTTLVSVGAQASGVMSVLSIDPMDPSSVPADGGLSAVTSVGTLLAAVISVLASALLNGVLVMAVSRAVLGSRITWGELWRAVRPRLPALVGITLLVGLGLALVVVVAVLPGVLLLVGGSGALGAVLLLVGIPVAAVVVAWLYVRTALAPMVLLLEDQPLGASLRRSWQLTVGSFWRVLGILLLANVVVQLLMAVLTAPFAVVGVVALFLAGPTTGAVVYLVLLALGSVVASTLAYPALASIAALLYIDLRMRREGLDVELARAAQAA